MIKTDITSSHRIARWLGHRAILEIMKSPFRHGVPRRPENKSASGLRWRGRGHSFRAERPEEGWTMVETDELLWEEFHRVVNMSSRELADWLRTCSARPEAEDPPERAGTPTGRQVLRILSKRRGDLTAEDRKVMR